MNKFELWWVSLRQARADVAYWKGQAEKWERKYAAAIQVRDSLSGQLGETQAALIELEHKFYPMIGVSVKIDPTLPPGTVESHDPDGEVVKFENVQIDED